MVVDRYTKVVLTVIAAALTVIAVRDLPISKPAFGEGRPIHVVVDTFDPWAFHAVIVPVKIRN